jgi:hypothetical protein
MCKHDIPLHHMLVVEYPLVAPSWVKPGTAGAIYPSEYVAGSIVALWVCMPWGMYSVW